MRFHRAITVWLAVGLIGFSACGRPGGSAGAVSSAPTSEQLQRLGEQMFPKTEFGYYIECTLANPRHGAPPYDYRACPITSEFRARLVPEQVMLVPVQNPSGTREVQAHASAGGGTVRVILYGQTSASIPVDLVVRAERGEWLVDDVAHKGGLDSGVAPSPLPLELPPAGETNRQKAALVARPASTPSPANTNSPVTEILLKVPAYHQALELSCEEASLRMALAWENIAVTDQQVLDFIGIDHTQPTHDANGDLRWGDPYAHFLGDPSGSEVSMTGYGTYYPTIAAAATHFGGRVVQKGEGVAPGTLYDAVLQGHPAVVWVTYHWGTPARHDFTATDGRRVPYAGPVEHAVTLVGVRPDSVWVNNPLTGLERISRTVFEASYDVYGDMAVMLD